MSKISTVYDYFITQLATLFSEKTRIPNPYSIEDNNVQFIQDGYGLKVNGNVLALAQFNQITTDHTFSIVISKEVFRLESDSQGMDTAIKSLEEDIFKVREFFYNIDCNGLPESIDLINLGPTDSTEFFFGPKNKFIFSEVNLIVKISEVFATC